MREKKVLLVATVQSHIAQFHRPLVEMLHAHGYEVHVAAYDNLAEKNGLNLDFVEKVFNIPFSRSPISIDNISAYNKLKAVIDSTDYEVIHCNTPMGGVIARLAGRKARKKGTKIFYTAHGFHFYKGASLKNWILFYPIEKLLSLATDTLITITQEDYRLALDSFYCNVEYIHGVGVDPCRFKTISEESKASLREKMGFLQDAKIILCIGELNANKNQVMAIRMMRKIIQTYPNAILLIAGNGPKESYLQEQIKAEDVENNVRLLGYVTNLQEYQNIADVQVSCSFREGLPLNVIESMLSGNPVVATLNRGHRELIQSGNNGFIVKYNDYQKMGEYVLMLLEDMSLCNMISTAGYNFAQDYTYACIKKELEDIYFGKGDVLC